MIDDTLITDIANIQDKLTETNRQTTTVSTGVSVINATQNALASAEIEGRTLTSLANSNLESGKKYVLADPKTRVTVDNVLYSGVAKFTKGQATVSTANYVGKVSGSTVVNANVAKYQHNTTSLMTPSSTVQVYELSSYNNLASLNSANYTYSTTTNGAISQSLFSFDIIQQIERNLGVIPRTTLADKIQWVKDNVESLTANWHGFGSSVGGNKATLSVWVSNSNAWMYSTSTASSTVSKLTINAVAPINNYIDSNGFMHYLAYADASDGVIASTINTDYIDLVITLKATAQLNTRARIIRVESFEGKVSGSVVENPHKTFRATSSTLTIPSEFSLEHSQAWYDLINKIDDTSYSYSGTINGHMSQTPFSFNLIEAVERNIGRIPRSTVADKVAWLNANLSKLTANWHGFGSSVGGSKANFAMWRNNWTSNVVSHTNGTVSKLTCTASDILNYLDVNGFVHFLAYADPSDGVTASAINTDYIDLEIEVSPTADFTNPRVALYEVADEDYNKILVDWNAGEVANRFPIVEGVQHLQGVGVLAEGENLLPPFSEWALHANAKVIAPYELELNATATGQVTSYIMKVIKGQTYNINLLGVGKVAVYKSIGGVTSGSIITYSNLPYTGTFTPTDVDEVKIFLSNDTTATGTFKFTNPMLTLGSVVKPFVPRNPSYLFADVKLGGIGMGRDRLSQGDNNTWLLRESVKKDLILDGSLAWGAGNDYAGYKRTSYATLVPAIPDSNVTIDHRGIVLVSKDTTASPNRSTVSSAGVVYVSVSDTDTGFAESFIPVSADWKRYFNGWKYVDGTTWTSVTGNGQTATVQVALDTKPTDYTPYKVSHVLTAPQTIDVTNLVEGNLKVSGLTQVEALSGVVRREKVTPVLLAGKYYINRISQSSSLFKNKNNAILTVYKNGNKDNRWTFITSSLYNRMGASINEANFDTNAEYTVTYIMLDKLLLTTNPTNVKLTYASNISSVVSDLVTKVEDSMSLKDYVDRAILGLATHLADNTSHVYYSDDTGTNNAKKVSIIPKPTTYKLGLGISFKNKIENTNSVTINVDSLGDKPIVKSDGTALVSGDLKADSIYTVRYNGVSFILQGERGGLGSSETGSFIIDVNSILGS